MMMLVGLVGGSIQRLTDSMMQVQDGFAALERMRNVLIVLPTPDDAPHAKKPPIRGTVVFDRVRFGYDSRKPIIQDFSFTFAAGKSYALVGPSGSGKSTYSIASVLYDPQGDPCLMHAIGSH